MENYSTSIAFTDIRRIPQEPEHVARPRRCYFRANAPLQFMTPEGKAFRLETALEVKSLEGLLHQCNTRALIDCGSKYRIVVHPEGQPKFALQKSAQGRDARGNALGKIARQVAEVVEAYADEMTQRAPGRNDSWRIGTGYIEFKDIYLLELQQISLASFMPVLGISSLVSSNDEAMRITQEMNFQMFGLDTCPGTQPYPVL
ncbi:hypothetical protein BDW22DRAFT_1360831 [Trametopsis cervina]|nr:hypothetical protein BDW22DRAFT_1360831 [Trametopsis cervina]